MSNKLEDLVPPLELCKKIPAGEFEDSALEWFKDCFFGEWHVEKRGFADAFTGNGELYPAPTLQEILRATSPGGYTGVFCSHEGDGDWSIGDCERDLYVKNGYEGENPETLALRWWFKQKGIEA